MKKLLYIFFTILIFTSCNDYLKETADDLFIPVNVSDFSALLIGETVCTNYDRDLEFTHVFTDDVMMLCPWPGSPWPLLIDEIVFDIFKWPADYQLYSITDNNYSNRYKNIRGCNVVINAIPTMEGSQGDIDLLEAQARTLRAYFFFNLINLYAKPYNVTTADTDPGVIMYLDGGVTAETFERSTVQEVWDQINIDLTTALEKYETATLCTNNFMINKYATLLMATRVALFQERWDDVITYGNLYLQGKSDLYNLNTVTKFGYKYFNIIDPINNPEVVYNFGKNSTSSYNLNYFSSSMLSAYFGQQYALSEGIEGALIDCYEDEDLRLKTHMIDGPPYCPGGKWYSTSVGKGFPNAWRTPEVYLSVAEALVQRNTGGDIQEALDLVNTLRQNRIEASSYTPKTYGDFGDNTDELLAFVREERRKEFAFEEAMRFWDLRRQGMPQLTHVFLNAQGDPSTYVLPQGSPNYTLLIPESEISFNDVIEQNERENIPVSN